MKNIDLIEESRSTQRSGLWDSEDIISFQTEIPKPIQQAMKNYIEKHPNWDQYRLIQADLYNLQPVIGEINGMRSNYKMSIIKGEKRNYGKCDIEFKNKLVEPSEKIRGDIARTYFYMAETYPEFIKLSKKELNLFYEWDHNDPVDKWECIRSRLIKNIQGNINNVIETRCKINEILQN